MQRAAASLQMGRVCRFFPSSIHRERGSYRAELAISVVTTSPSYCISARELSVVQTATHLASPLLFAKYRNQPAYLLSHRGGSQIVIGAKQ